MQVKDMNTIQGQPLPNDSRPVWDIVVEEAGQKLVGLKAELARLSACKPGRETGLQMRAVERQVEALTLAIQDMRRRDALGAHKYGCRLQAFNGRDQLADAYQELMDLVVYLRAAVVERESEPTRAERLKETEEAEARSARLAEKLGAAQRCCEEALTREAHLRREVEALKAAANRDAETIQTALRNEKLAEEKLARAKKDLQYMTDDRNGFLAACKRQDETIAMFRRAAEALAANVGK